MISTVQALAVQRWFRGLIVSGTCSPPSLLCQPKNIAWSAWSKMTHYHILILASMKGSRITYLSSFERYTSFPHPSKISHGQNLITWPHQDSWVHLSPPKNYVTLDEKNGSWGQPVVSDTVLLWHFRVTHSRWAIPYHIASSFVWFSWTTNSFTETWIFIIPAIHWYHLFNIHSVNTYFGTSYVMEAKDGKLNKAQSFPHRVHSSKKVK